MEKEIPVVTIYDDKNENIATNAITHCGSNGCDTDDIGGLPESIRQKIDDHPCYSDDAHSYFARMHVPVAPKCNIQCNYCNRKFDCANETRPGVVSKRLKPEQAVKKVLAVAQSVPELSVVGIAGPGDAFASGKQTLETIKRLHNIAPELKLCVSTNGLMLPDYIDELVKYKVDHVTVTINTLDPKVGAKIYDWVYYMGKKLRGEEAAAVLIERQLASVSQLSRHGILVKVNSVYIPGINDNCIAKVNQEVQRRGAFIHNVMPLISKPEFGTKYSKLGQREPTMAELAEVRQSVSGGVRVMKHCRLCRADAIGRLGQDVQQQFEFDDANSDVTGHDAAWLKQYKSSVAKIRQQRSELRQRVSLAFLPAQLVKYYLVATTGDGLINQHFGHATEFLIYQVSHQGCRLHGRLDIGQYCLGGEGNDAVLDEIIAKIQAYDGLFVSKIGRCPKMRLQLAKINVVTDYAQQDIEYSLKHYVAEAYSKAGKNKE